MIEPLFFVLIRICVLALVIYLVLWLLQKVAGLSLPPRVIQILWMIFALIALLLLLRAMWPMSGGLL